MKIAIHGHSYTVLPEYLQATSIRLLNEDDTVVLYINESKNEIDEYDTILIVNTRLTTVFPLFLSVFNDMVQPYDIPLVRTFPAYYILSTTANEFMICDYERLLRVDNVQNNGHVAYAEKEGILLVAPNLHESFKPFNNQKLSNYPETTNKRVMIGTSPNLPPVSPAIANYVANNNQKQEVARETRPTPVVPVVQTAPVPKAEPIKPTPASAATPTPRSVPVKPRLNVQPSKENLWKYCNINDDCIVITLVVNETIVVVNKKYGTVKYFTFESIISNELLGFATKEDILKCLNKTLNIAYDTKKVVITDIRHVIRLFEQRKENPATKQMIAYTNQMLYVALAPDNTNASIKQFTIDCHKQAAVNYETLKTDLKVFSRDIYFVLSNNNVSAMCVFDGGKKAYDIKLDELYALYPDAKNIGDLMRMVPIEQIINGSFFDIDNTTDVLSVVPVPANVLGTTTTPYYTIKGMNYGYDPRSRVIMKAPISTI